MLTKDLGEVLLSLGNEAQELYLPRKIKLLEHPPSALVFLREYVMPNIPVVIKNGVKHWPAIKKWTDDYLVDILGNKSITVALTPNGYADAPQALDISWASEAFGKAPDAINFWMGSSNSVTSMHKDHYENMYAVVRGAKKFILHPPTDLPYLIHKQYIPARYKKENGVYKIFEERNIECCQICLKEYVSTEIKHSNMATKVTHPVISAEITQDNIPNKVSNLNCIDKFNIDIKNASDSISINNQNISCSHDCHILPRIPWIATNPLNLDDRTNFLYKQSHPLEVTVQSGDLLYLPSLWFHHVQQEDNTIAINFWYDMDYDIKYNYFKFIEQINNLLRHTDIH
ncbi:bifunctional peptidase and (3S)-lysyl hydroxylase Jmjd7 isoform X2 [Hydra vulgaris]|uniref:bifunctional peptidase and (3S)-lysyl hydroxylase Jmjd7 isoform X2 n=1 Tax=Hydra vulgaris TaxID=6087 RepID=UPI001F5E68B0|nr:bifunctional peptidase and (3S)-lysyl hydroxylase Jmjd7 isoform X3 [Hydra vulgaris]